MPLTSALFSTPAVDAAFDDDARVAAMLEVEAALARAEAALGLVPPDAADAIARACAAGPFPHAELAARAAAAGNLAIPLVEALTRRVAQESAAAAGFVHWGATSQDVIDTGLALQVRRAGPLLLAEVDRLAQALARLARTHRLTLMPGRTWLQHAPPVTLGLKAAGALDALRRVRRRLVGAADAMAVLQFGGAAGTLASLGDRGMDVAEALARELGLARPALPWHAHRDRVADLGAALALACGLMGKLGRDLSLLMQTEAAEAFEPAAPGKGGSSTMPHKRNPVGCAVALAAATRAPGLAAALFAALPQEHERGLGGWHAEWETLPELFRLAAGAVAAMATAYDGLEVDAGRMAQNLSLTHGLLLSEAVAAALARHIGREAAHAAMQVASRRALDEGRSLSEVLHADPALAAPLGPSDIDALLDPGAYLGSATAFIDAVLAEEPDLHG